MSPFTEILHISISVMCSVYIEHMMPINQPLLLLTLFYSGYDGVGKAITVCEQGCL